MFEGKPLEKILYKVFLNGTFSGFHVTQPLGAVLLAPGFGHISVAHDLEGSGVTISA